MFGLAARQGEPGNIPTTTLASQSLDDVDFASFSYPAGTCGHPAASRRSMGSSTFRVTLAELVEPPSTFCVEDLSGLDLRTAPGADDEVLATIPAGACDVVASLGGIDNAGVDTETRRAVTWQGTSAWVAAWGLRPV